MKSKDFQALLLRGAVIAMSIDGEVAEAEKQELARIASSTAYFLGMDHTTILPKLLADSSNTDKEAASRFIQAVQAASLSPTQETILLEVVLRVIEADDVVLPTERALLRDLRPVLQLSDGALLARFPRLISYLMRETESVSDVLGK